MAGGATPTVLVVDDEPSIRMLCRVNLELDGYEVVEAATLAEARAALAAQPLAAVLLDVHLGAHTSYDFVAECAAHVPRIPVALLTGSADGHAAELDGVDAVLPKPFDVDHLGETMHRLASLER